MRLWTAVLLLALAGCRTLRDDDSIREVESTAHEVDAQVKRTRTLSNLAHLEQAVADYYKSTGAIPTTLEKLVPKFLAEIPPVELSVRGHAESSEVQVYPRSVLRGGQVDGSQLKDTGRWGYVFNERQIVIFVDCTHPAGDGKSWYQERGVY